MAKILFLWESLPSYITKCLESLARIEKSEIIVGFRTEGFFKNANSKLSDYQNIKVMNLWQIRSEENYKHNIIKKVNGFNPDIAMITLSKWGLFAKIAKELKRRGCIVIGACDHYWKGDWKDFGNAVASRFGIFSNYEAISVPGVLGVNYAKKIGFKENKIFEGIYTADTEIFQPIGLKRHHGEFKAKWPRVFLFVGQYIYRKGIDILLYAYNRYKKLAGNPWEIWFVGKGELEYLIQECEGAKNLGPKNSEEIAELMGKVGCFILPSRIDHWGVVIHEACCSGLPVLASNTCGSSIEFIQNGYNGFTFPRDDYVTLSKLMLMISESGYAEDMGKNSLQISYRLSPDLWARKLLNDIPFILRDKSLINGKKKKD